MFWRRPAKKFLQLRVEFLLSGMDFPLGRPSERTLASFSNLCELCSVNWSETFDSCIKDNPFFLLAFQIFPPNSSFVFAFVLPFIIKPSWSFHLISYVPFPFYGLWVFYFTRVKQEVSSGPRWFIWSPRFYSQVLIILFFTFISLFHLKFAFILCIVWGLHFIFLLMDRAMPA